MNHYLWRFLLLITTASVFPGCGGEKLPPNMPKLYPCTITITQEGKPFAGASVSVFSEDSSLAEWYAGGVTDQNGVCVLQTQAKYPGVVSGKFKVTVSKMETEPSQYGGDPAPGKSEEEWNTLRGNEVLKSWRLVGKEYSSSSTSTLTLEVTTGKNAETFDVGKAIRELL